MHLSERTTGSQFQKGFEKGLEQGLEPPSGLRQGLGVKLNKGLEQGPAWDTEQELEQGRQEGMELGVQAGQLFQIQKLLFEGDEYWDDCWNDGFIQRIHQKNIWLRIRLTR